MISTNSERGDDGFSNPLPSPSSLYRFLYLGGSHSSVTLVGHCPHGALIFALTAIMMGMMGPRFAKFQTLLERLNACAKGKSTWCARGQILCTRKSTI